MHRRPARTVHIGSFSLGSKHPVLIQSMTTTPTHDVEATVKQILALEKAGCSVVRVTVQGKREALACKSIKERLLQENSSVALVADIHFYPPAAMTVIEYVDKVRINPGNFAERRATFQEKILDDQEYEKELLRIRDVFSPLVKRAKELKKPLRIGCNHGSLSDRILTRYGDTPKGMVVSAIEYAAIAREFDFHDMIFSMKASNPKVMLEAYRLLVEEFNRLGWDYPLHLGVTEAGALMEGRVKSAIGIGTLLMEGLGDTIRVSLTENPLQEIPPAQLLVEKTEKTSRYWQEDRFLQVEEPKMQGVLAIAFNEVLSHRTHWADLFDLQMETFPWKRSLASPDFLVGGEDIDPMERENLAKSGITVIEESALEERFEVIYPTFAEYAFLRKKCSEEKSVQPRLIGIRVDKGDEEDVIESAILAGSFLIDGLASGIYIKGNLSFSRKKALSLEILQGARQRTFKTEFVSCPGCGRTLFDLESVAADIRDLTGHIPGLKIAVMGCIVNGPGEMADAHFGYVGSKSGFIDLYQGKECVERNIPMQESGERLVDLIKKAGMWQDPPSKG